MKTFKLAILVLILAFSITYSHGRPGGYIMTANIPLKGKATGGTLILGNVEARNSNFACVETLPGESGQSVVYKLAKAIAYSDDIFEISRWDNINRERMLADMTDGDTLRIKNFPPGMYFLAGTEKGFGIPRPPLSLSCTYYKAKDEITLNWINPPDNYDYIYVRMFKTGFMPAGSRRLDGNSTSTTFNRKQTPFDVNDLDVRVFGFRNTLPSNLAVIHLSNNGNCQDELFGVPFTDGIAPNWKAWSTGDKIEKNAFEQYDKYSKLRLYYNLRALSTKPFYQVIKGSATGNVHGIYRKFMGLKPGHTYRIIAGLSTLDMNSIEIEWSASLCATYNRGTDKLNAKQFAGLSALPNGKKGASAGQIASFGKNKGTTKGKFSIVGGNAETHITLPDGVDTITVWIRFDCKDPNGKIGFSGVRLEDITASKNIKTLEQISHEEFLQERSLMNREKALKLEKSK